MSFQRLPPVIEFGDVTTIGIRELDRRASRFARSIKDGTRTLLTWHGQPRGIVFSMRDAIELALAAEFEQFETWALEDHDEGKTAKPWPEWGPREIYASSLAASVLEGDAAKSSHVIWHELRRVRREQESPMWMPGLSGGGRWLVPFSLLDSETVVVHAVIDAWEVERELAGDEVVRDCRRRSGVRLARCREPVRRSTAERPPRAS